MFGIKPLLQVAQTCPLQKGSGIWHSRIFNENKIKKGGCVLRWFPLLDVVSEAQGYEDQVVEVCVAVYYDVVQ